MLDTTGTFSFLSEFCGLPPLLESTLLVASLGKVEENLLPDFFKPFLMSAGLKPSKPPPPPPPPLLGGGWGLGAGGLEVRGSVVDLGPPMGGGGGGGGGAPRERKKKLG